MEQIKKTGVFLLILILLGSCVTLAFWDTVSESVGVIVSGTGRDEYFLTGTDSEGGIYALGRREGVYHVVRGTPSGRREDRYTLPEQMLPDESIPAAFYPASDGTVYLGLYDTGVEPAELKLYRISGNGKKAELLLSEAGTGQSLREQMASVRLSDFTSDSGSVSFAVLSGDSAHFYVSAESGLSDVGSAGERGLRGAMALSEDVWVLVTDHGLVRTDRGTAELSGDEIITQLDQAGTGVYYVDGASLKVFYADFADWRPYSYLTLEKSRYDMDDCADLRVSRGGDVVLLMNDGRLLLDRGSSVSDLSGMLHRSVIQCVLILAALAVGVLLVSFVLWYIICVQRRLRLPMLLKWGVLLTAAAVLASAGMATFLSPAFTGSSADREARAMLSSAVSTAGRVKGIDDVELALEVSRSLSGAGGGFYRDARAAVYATDGETWRLTGGSVSSPQGIRAELCPGFDEDIAESALKDGSAWAKTDTSGSCRYSYAVRTEGQVLIVDVDGSQLRAQCAAGAGWMTAELAGLATLLTILSLLALSGVAGGLRKLMKGIEALIRGEREFSVKLRGGDELASLGDDLTALSQAMSRREEEHRELESSYRRFVPERILSLLGKQSIGEVDKRTFVARNLATMKFSFRFPESTYERSGRELFDNVNEIIERTASIVTKRGGAVFNFAFDGYDAVFESGSRAAVSAAVAIQQEILELNREREAEERPAVAARITLDEGTVILGVVGDEYQIEPTSISASFSEARRLMELCVRLDATILCTEAVITSAEGYSSRYIGKCSAGGSLIRTYEIFDGDPYESRKFKEQTKDSFADGIYAFYGQDWARAKSIFLSLVRRSTGDGCARYYLYLSDRLEKDDTGIPSLDSGL